MIDIPNQANSAVPQSPANESPSQLTNAICKKCQTVVQENFYFCPNCGKKLKEPPFRFSWTNIAGNMFISILLPPLGVFPGIKHLRIHDQKTKLLGALYIVATTIATLAMLFIIYDSVHNLNKILNEVYQVKSYY